MNPALTTIIAERDRALSQRGAVVAVLLSANQRNGYFNHRTPSERDSAILGRCEALYARHAARVDALVRVQQRVSELPAPKSKR